MGELLFCHEPIAALPYYVEGIGINLYSMEELCYYIMGNTYLLDNSFMSEELCTWVEKQMGLYKLAEQLRDIMRGAGTSLGICAGNIGTERILHDERDAGYRPDDPADGGEVGF